MKHLMYSKLYMTEISRVLRIRWKIDKGNGIDITAVVQRRKRKQDCLTSIIQFEKNLFISLYIYIYKFKQKLKIIEMN